MHDLALEVPEPVDTWPLLVVEQATSTDEHVASVFDHAPIWLLDMHMPLALVLIPPATGNLVFELCESLNAVFACGRLQVLANLFCRGIQCRPIMLGVERELVRMRRHVTCCSRVTILVPDEWSESHFHVKAQMINIPCSTNTLVLLVNNHFAISQSFWQSDSEIYA